MRFIARHVPDYWAALAVLIALGVAVWAIVAVVLSVLAGAAGAAGGGLLRGTDEQALIWLSTRRVPALDQVMTRLTRLGDGIVVIAIAIVAATLLAVLRHRWSAYLLLAGVLGGQVMNNVLKLVFARPRPQLVEWGTDVATASFPSGHAMSAMIAWGSIAYVVGRLEPAPAVRRASWAVATLLIAGIGLSRVYLGVHYPTDVFAGYIAGFVWVVFVAATSVAARMLDDEL